ncbi:helix-turn-helix domain-containing protein [Hyphococcus luteus]|uniref:DNA-binding protein n=1 Tax=Hyphococcus luteus TaxID=2058213 RepID=A0A2S7K8I5_9PROT|nr:helix-turn-helix domain-containing protein [Marinicaulis flavus]PQA88825.1 DNA-binding protein [Marinicaulis flavus]
MTRNTKETESYEDPEYGNDGDDEDDDDLDQLFTVEEAARELRMGKSTLNRYRCEGRGPIYRKHGSRVFYTKRSLRRWSRRDRYKSTSQRVRRDR